MGGNFDASKLSGSLDYTSSSKNAGTYTSAAGTLTLSGLYSGQQGYDISYANSSLTINKADLAITGITASDKTYDGTNSATLNGTAGVAAIGQDVVSVSGTGTGTFADKNAGAGKAVTVTGYSLSGADADNYTLIQPTGLTADINKAALIVTANDARKTYDGQAWNGGNGVSYSGFANGEDDAVLNGTLSYGGSAQGATNAGTYALSASGLISGNYEIHYQDGALLVSAAPTKTAPPSSSQPYLSVLASNSQTMSTEAEPLTQETEAMEQVTLITNPLDDHLNLQVVNHGIRLPEGI